MAYETSVCDLQPQAQLGQMGSHSRTNLPSGSSVRA
jgi:hypothetical protein